MHLVKTLEEKITHMKDKTPHCTSWVTREQSPFPIYSKKTFSSGVFLDQNELILNGTL